MFRCDLEEFSGFLPYPVLNTKQTG